MTAINNIIVSESPETLAEKIAEDFARRTNETLARQEKFSVALAGGVTPKLFYARLAKSPYATSIPWSRLWIFWGDERCVPPDHPDSNYRMANETLLRHVPVRPAHVNRMRGEDPPPKAAKDYEAAMREFFREAGLWPSFDLIFLGLGPDGHTASLIPSTPAVEGETRPDEERRHVEAADSEPAPPRWVVHNVIRAQQTVRLTMTFPVFNQAKAVWFLVTGAKKREVFAEVQKGPDPAWPASLVQPVRGELRWYVDKAVVNS
jgi:6-phosphogluconolactonase